MSKYKMMSNDLFNMEGNVVLIYYQDQPSIFARIEFIEPDMKKGWYQITLLLLTIPTRTVTWILRESYIQGDTFQMDGRSIRLEVVQRVNEKKDVEKPAPAEKRKKTDNEKEKGGTVIPFKNHKL